jgi:hypothetical protein
LEACAIVEPSPTGETFLECATACPKRDVVSLALMMDSTYDGGALCSATFRATRARDNSIVEELLSRRPSNKSCDSFEASALSVALLYDTTDLAQTLIAKLPTFKGLCKIPVCRGTRFSDYFRDWKWIHEAQQAPVAQTKPWEDESRVVFWRDPEFITGSPLLVAVYRGEESIIQRLLELGYPLDAMTVSFSIFTRARSVPMLLRHYPITTPFNDDSFPNNPAYFAVEVGDISTLRLLESMGHSICTASSQGDWQERRTIFQRAVEKGQRDIIDFLLDAGANVNEPANGYEEETALQLAAKNGDLRTAERLLALAADIHARSGSRMTALMEAASHGRIDMLQLLLNHCNRARDGWNTEILLAAAYAALRGHYGIVDILKHEETWSANEERKLELMVENRCLKVEWQV